MLKDEDREAQLWFFCVGSAVLLRSAFQAIRILSHDILALLAACNHRDIYVRATGEIGTGVLVARVGQTDCLDR